MILITIFTGKIRREGDNVMPRTAYMIGKHTNTLNPREKADRMNRMKSKSRCRGCGELGNWICDNPECDTKDLDKENNRGTDGKNIRSTAMGCNKDNR